MTWWTRAHEWRRAHAMVSDVLLALVIFAVGVLGEPTPANTPQPPPTAPVIALLGLACAALVARRLAPVAVWAATVGVAAVSVVIVSGPTPAIVTPMVALYTIATLRPARIAVLAGIATPIVLIGTYVAVSAASLLNDATYTLIAVSAMACAIGFAVKGNRALVAAAEERARIAEQTREEEAQHRVAEERLHIARELHDVVAHHIAVINVQSGVARHLIDSDPAAAAEALGHVREASSVVLSEMSTILGLLRTSDEGEQTQPAPGLDQVDVLVESVRRSGTAVALRFAGSPRELAPGTDLAAYRIVQESLTNAGKHGAGSAQVTVEYRDHDLVIDVTNPMAAGQLPGDGRTGHGLVGMRERVSALGGRLEAGPRTDGRFVVHAELPVGVAS